MSLVTDSSQPGSQLSPTKQALLQKWLRGEYTTQAIPRRSSSGPAPLSFSQQRLWFLDQLVPGSPAYNVPGAVRLKGSLNVAALEASLNEIVKRHETLRTTFALIEGEPAQLIAAAATLPLAQADLEKFPPEERERRAVQEAEQEAQQPFDLASGPLFRAKLLCLANDDHVLLLTLHHIISDGWSVGVFVRELVTLYQAFSAGQPSPLPELPIQYADFAYWQRQWLQGSELDRQLAYWREQLANAPTALDLPTDRPRPTIQTFQGAALDVQLPGQLTEDLKALSQQTGATLFMTLMAAFQILLARYSRQEDILVGSPIANRSRVETEGLIGFFVNTLVVRTNLSGNPSFQDVLARVREATLGAYAHQDLPFEKLVEELQPGRDTSRNPLFQVMFVLQNTPLSSVQLPELELSPIEAHSGTAKFDLWLSLAEGAQGLSGTIEYSTDLFDEATIQRFGRHFCRLLEGIVADPQQRLSELPLLSQAEQVQFATWNATAVDYPLERCLHEWIEQQVERTPDAPAIVFPEANQRLTYRELNDRADQLAQHLRACGVGPDVPVGICAERSLELVISLLGILKAGGAYVPLDPTYPEERIAYMLADARIEVLLTQSRLLAEGGRWSLAGGDPQPMTICLDTEWETITDYQPPAPSPQPPTPDSLAYVIYTSGSTGQPKGAMNAHRGVVNRLLWMQERYRLSEADAVLQKTPFSFDVSVWEFFWPLMTGARLVLARPEGHKDSAYLVEMITQQAITTVHFVPSMLGVFLDTPGLERCSSLKRVICSGEALPAEFQERFHTRLPHGAELHNLYGPTEAAIDVTAWACDRERPSSPVPIGQPIANIQIHILDEHLRPVPIGVPGELYIGGVGVGRGYWGRPELTAERFIPNPFLQKAEGGRMRDEDLFRLPPSAFRLYKTGDLARYRPQGDIEYLGRLDFQVKLRGFRIELGEIEAVLRQSPTVQDAAVIATESESNSKKSSGSSNSKQLVAYLVPRAAGEGQATDDPLPAAHVAQWQSVFDKTYAEAAQPSALAFNLAGWNSSYTGDPIPAEEMHEWVDQTVERILALNPRQVLEIGCGSGLLLFRIAPACAHYWGTDFSPQVLNDLKHSLATTETRWPVTLLQQAANDLEGIPLASVDTVILNSVIQYFPSLDYLIQVLEGAIRVVSPGGRLFMGDVQNLPLLELFHASVEFHRASDSLSVEQLWRRTQKRAIQEQELVIDPAFFPALKARFPRLGHVAIRLKRGRHLNELTRFRYDVILHLDTETQPADLEWLDWREAGLTLPALRQKLTETQPEQLSLARIPNARLATSLQLRQLLVADQGPETVKDLHGALEQIERETAIDPEDLWALGQELNYAVEVCWSASETQGDYDVLLRKLTPTRPAVGPCPSFPLETLETLQPWQTYANHPLQEKRARQLTPELKRFLKEKLPEHMLPTVFIWLERLPLSPNGKLDRPALPPPPPVIPEMEESFVAPRTAVEETLAQAWAQVLGLERVGIHDNFFELGGDSIQSIQVVNRVSQAGLRLQPKHLFQYQTIAELAEVVATAPPSGEAGVPSLLPLIPAQRRLFDQSLPDLQRQCQILLLETPPGFNSRFLGQVLHDWLVQHPALRLRFEHNEAGWQQTSLSSDEAFAALQQTLSALATAELEDSMPAALTQHIERLNLIDGPPFRAVFFDHSSDQAGRLWLIFHDAVVDHHSWHILLEDLQTAYQQFQNGEKLRLQAELVSFQRWAHSLAQQTQTSQLQSELSYWLKVTAGGTSALPRDYPPRPLADSARATLSVSLNSKETARLLHHAQAAYRTRVDELLLTALAQTLQAWTGQHSFLIDHTVERRENSFEGLDLSRTVGRLSFTYPVRLELPEKRSPAQAIKAIKEQLRQIPQAGLGYGLLRFSNGKAGLLRQFQEQPGAQINFQGVSGLEPLVPAQSAFKLLQGPNLLADRKPSTYLLEISSRLIAGELCLEWVHDETVYRRSTIERLAKNFVRILRSLIMHCLSSQAGGYTPSDFPLAGLDQPALDRLPLPKGKIEDLYPLGPMQSYMFSRHRALPEPGLHIVHQVFRLPAAGFNSQAFKAAWEGLVERYPTLRTSFVWEGLTDPLQVVHRHVRLPLEEHDWRKLSQPEQAKRMRRRVREIRYRGFDLSQAPHTYLALIRTSDDLYHLFWSFNYMLQEGWSFPLITRDLFALYDALVRGQEIHLEQPRPFRDYIAWIKQQDPVKAEAFWRKMLQGFKTPTPLVNTPPRHLAPDEDNYTQQSMVLSLATTTAVRALARQHQLTVNTFLQAAWALVLSRYTGQEEVVFGSISSGRPAELVGVEQMVGCFNNLLPMRVKVTPTSHLLSWLRDFQARQVEMRQYEYSSPSQIKAWSEVPADQLLFDNYLVFENYPVDPSVAERGERWAIQAIDGLTQTEHPLRVQIWPAPLLSVFMYYYPRCFDPQTVTQLLNDYRTVLEGMLSNRQQRLEDLLRLIK